MSNHQQHTLQLRRHGLRATPARLSLLSLLEHENKPMSAKDIEQHPKLKDMNQATLYRNLQNLKSAGLIRQLDLQERHGFYEISSKGDHHHIVCVQCGRIQEIDNCPALEFSDSVLDQATCFSSVLHHSLEFYGLCRQCAGSTQ